MKKSIVALSAGLIIGILGSLLFMPKVMTVGNIKSSYGKIQWNPLPPGEGPDAINMYKEETKDLWHNLRVKVDGKDSVLRGFWIDKKMIEAIFAQDPINTTGFRMYFGKKKNASKREYTLVFVGTKGPINRTNGGTDFGTYFDYVDPCPTNCGEN